MAPSDIVYCDQCGGASPRGTATCRFCGAALPPPRTATRAPTVASTPLPGAHDDDPWAELTAPDPAAVGGPETQSWGDPEHLPWRAGAEQAEPQLDPTIAGHPLPEPTAAYGVEPPADAGWSGGPLIDPEELGPRRGLPGWAWVASVVMLGSLLGVGAYLVVDRTDDGAVRTTDPPTTTSSSTTSTTLAPTTTTAAPAPTVPVIPATPPATAPVTGPPTVPGAVTTPSTVPESTVPETTTVPPTAAPTTPAPTAAPTTPAPTAAPTTPAPTTPPGGAAPGDLGIPGIPMSQPPCDGRFVTFLASVKNTSGPAMQEALQQNFPGASYLRTDQTCPSLNIGASDGTPLYRIFVGPFATEADACAARVQSEGAFVKRLSAESPAHVVACT